MRSREPGDTVQLSKVRIRETLRAALEREAAQQKTTMNAVIADRLERSFEADAQLGGPQTAALLRFLGAIVKAGGYDDAWLADRRQFNEIVQSWVNALDRRRAAVEPADGDQQRRELEEFRLMIGKSRDRPRARLLARRLSEITNLDPEIRDGYAALAKEPE